MVWCKTGSVIPKEVWVRLVRFQGERCRPGSGFVIEEDGIQYLITAKHLCNGELDELITIRHPWTNSGISVSFVLSRKGPIDTPGDVAAFVLPASLVRVDNRAIPLDVVGLAISQECYILGYPYDLSTSMGRGGTQDLPFVKRGIFAGSGDVDGVKSWYIDVIANPGFSGGPLVYLNKKSRRWQFAGVVVGSMSAPVAEPTAEEPSPPRFSAGLSVAVDAAVVHALLI